jgi:hypothetical protein
MRMRILFAVALAAAIALVPTPADAKGAREMTVAGPGLTAPIRLASSSESAASPNRLAVTSGLFNQFPDRHLGSRPAGDLGSRYVATYHWLIAQDKTTPIRQDVYPFTDVGAVTYTRPTEQVGEVRGGWYRAGPELTLLLIAVGVPVPAGYAAPVPVAAQPPLTG